MPISTAASGGTNETGQSSASWNPPPQLPGPRKGSGNFLCIALHWYSDRFKRFVRCVKKNRNHDRQLHYALLYRSAFLCYYIKNTFFSFELLCRSKPNFMLMFVRSSENENQCHYLSHDQDGYLALIYI